MFEPQDHPNVSPYPGAPPTPPYDNAGWTLAFQMGLRFDRLLEPPAGSFEKVTDWNVKPPPGRVAPLSSGGYWVVGRETNDAFKAINRLVKAGAPVTIGPPGFFIRVERGNLHRGNRRERRDLGRLHAHRRGRRGTRGSVRRRDRGRRRPDARAWRRRTAHDRDAHAEHTSRGAAGEGLKSSSRFPVRGSWHAAPACPP